LLIDFFVTYCDTVIDDGLVLAVQLICVSCPAMFKIDRKPLNLSGKI